MTPAERIARLRALVLTGAEAEALDRFEREDAIMDGGSLDAITAREGRSIPQMEQDYADAEARVEEIEMNHGLEVFP